MGILFKSRKLKSLQDGGSIPVYRTFQVRGAQQGQDNPSVLLQKYSGPAKKETSKEDTKKSSTPDYKLDGLDGDNRVISEKIKSLTGAMRDGIALHGEAFRQFPEGLAIADGLHDVQYYDIPALKNSKERLQESKEAIKGREKDWLYNGPGKGLVEKYEYDEEGNAHKVGVTYINGEELHKKAVDAEGNEIKDRPLYRALSRGDAVMMREREPEIKFINRDGTVESLIGSITFASAIGMGAGDADVVKYVKNFYDGVGSTSISSSSSEDRTGLDGNSVGKGESVSQSSNNSRLMNGYNELRSNLENTAEWDRMMAKAYQSSSLEIEEGYDPFVAAIMHVDEELSQNLFKRAKLTEDEKKTFKEDLSEGYGSTKASAGSGGAPGALAPYAADLLSTGKQSKYEITIPSESKDGMIVGIKVLTKNVPKINSLVSQSKAIVTDIPLAGEILDFDNVHLASYGNIGDSDWKTADGGTYNTKDLMMAVPGKKTMAMADMPFQNGKMIALEDIGPDENGEGGYTALAQEVATIMNSKDAKIAGGVTQEEADLEAFSSITALTSEFLSKHNIVMKTGVWGDYLLPKEGAPEGFLYFNEGKTEDGGQKIRQSSFKQATPAEYALYTKYKGAKDTDGEVDDGYLYDVIDGVGVEGLVKVSLFTETQSSVSVQNSSGKVEVPRNKISLDFLKLTDISEDYLPTSKDVSMVIQSSILK